MLPKDFTPDVIEDPTEPKPADEPREFPQTLEPQPPETPSRAMQEPAAGQKPATEIPAAPRDPTA